MTATIPPRSIAPSDVLDWSKLVELHQAAKLLGVNRDHLGRLCREQLETHGQAHYLKPPSGGKPRWFIDRLYDLRLAPDAIGRSQQTPDLTGYTKIQQQQAWQRAACVDTFNEARSTWRGNQKDWVPKLIGQLQSRFPGMAISRPSLLRWHAAYHNPADIVHLIDQRGGDTRSSGDPAAWSAFRDHYLEDRQPSIRSCWSRVKDLAREHGWSWCSYKSCQRQLDKRIPKEMQARHREPKKWLGQMQPGITQDPESWPAGRCWVGDHKQMDIWCLYGGNLIRPWLTAWMDWRTRRLAGWAISPSPNASSILAALRHGLLDESNMGGPSTVWIDNGKDYDCFAFHGQTKKQRLAKTKLDVDEPEATGLFKMLSIEPHFSLAYNPNGKARMERWFRSMEGFFKSFATYTGRSTDTKPPSLTKTLSRPSLIPSYEAVQSRLSSYITGYNKRTEHSIDDLVADNGARLSPDHAMAMWCTQQLVHKDPQALDLLLQAWHKPVTVGRNGITINVAGRNLSYGQFEPALSPMKAPRKKDRPQLYVSYDPHDLRGIRVFDAQYRFVCEAPMNQTGGRHGTDAITRAHVAKLNRDKTAYRNSLRFIRENYEQEYLTDAKLLADAALPDPSPTPPEPATMKIVQTPLDGQSNALQRDRVRKAAGAEHDEVPNGLPPASSLTRLLGRSWPGPADKEAHPPSFKQLTAVLPSHDQPQEDSQEGSEWEAHTEGQT